MIKWVLAKKKLKLDQGWPRQIQNNVKDMPEKQLRAL
jgi:hypothetical protein